jgi:hypothetical protein
MKEKKKKREKEKQAREQRKRRESLFLNIKEKNQINEKRWE